ncbi:LytR/AlgR family response regulator transcription factor [Pedobacter soli]|uniref:Two component transcriptional regulator, LytTR family n=1 Tax=Pedobacter soli TaxID=390242 RepID=A0A1G6U801_9SPHI|nr:LytTR family DNA-binding domain-containing protein [Pedobacter soli]SDD37411.1 two component transcriptional regulator, LytTR family [Pedobacter soli]
MALKCVAIDDEPLALELIKNYVSRFPGLQLVQVFEDALSGAEYLKQNPVDLLFVDVNMPDISGVELVRSLVNSPMIIFTTAYRNYAFESYELQAIDYLLKPIDFNRFTAAVEKAIDFHKYKNATQENTSDESIYVYSEYKMIKILLRDIEYIESMGDYLKIYLCNADKPVLTLMTMKKVLERLPEDQFARVHRSFIVALTKIKSIHNRKVNLTHVEVPVGDAYSGFINQQKGI